MIAPSTRKILLGLIDRGGPRDDLNFQAGAYPPGLAFHRASAATVFAPNRLGPELVTSQNLDVAPWNRNSPMYGNWWGAAGSGNRVSVGVDGQTYAAAAYRISVAPGQGFRFSVNVSNVSATSIYLNIIEGLNGGWKRQFVYPVINTGVNTFDFPTGVDIDSLEFVLHVYGPPGASCDFSNYSIQEIIVGNPGDPKSHCVIGANKPRIAYDIITGACKGLQTEPASGNMIRFSNRLYISPWTTGVSGAGVTPVITSNYNGELGHTRIQMDRGADGTGDQSILLQAPPEGISSGVTYTGSFEVKATAAAGVGRVLLHRNVGKSAYMQITLTEEWQKVERPEAAYDTSPYFEIGLRGGQGSSQAVDFLIRNCQLEPGGVSTSHMPTQGSGASRAAEYAEWNMTDPIYGDTFAFEYERASEAAAGGGNGSIIFAGISGTGVEVYFPAGVKWPVALTYVSDNVTENLASSFTTLTDRLQRVAIRTNGRITGNGLQASSEALNQPKLLPNLPFQIGGHQGDYPFHGFIHRIRRFRRWLSDFEMQVLTMPNDASISYLDLARDLNFGLGGLPAGVTFSRASSATVFAPNPNADSPLSRMVVENNVPRFEYDPITKECLGLLVEPQRTNTVHSSGDMNGSAWTRRGGLTGGAAAPDGTGQLVTFGAEGQLDYYQVTTVPAGARCEVSFEVWPVSTSGTVRVQHPYSAAEGHYTVDLSKLSQGRWNRITRSHPAVTSLASFVGRAGDLAGFWYHAISGSPLTWYVKNHQVEIGEEATSYIPTNPGSAVTRAAEDVRLPLSLKRTDWTIALEDRQYSTKDSPVEVGLGTGTALYLSAGHMFGYYSGAGAVAWAPTVIALGDLRKAAAVHSGGTLRVALNGGAVGVSTGPAYADGNTLPTSVRLGAYAHGVQPSVGIYSRVRYFNRALSDQELQIITKI